MAIAANYKTFESNIYCSCWALEDSNGTSLQGEIELLHEILLDAIGLEREWKLSWRLQLF